MAKTATHKAAHLIDNIKHFQNLDQALTDYNIVVGTSARKGKQRFVQYTPRKMVEKLQPYLTENKVAILFGPEDAGLTNEELNYCKMSSYIPTADFSSLNLAQAVAIHCYELYHGIVCAPTEIEPAQEFATHHELESMYGYMEESLHAINFIDETSHAHWMANVRHFFSRHGLTAKDANIVRGICKKFLFHQKSSANRSD